MLHDLIVGLLVVPFEPLQEAQDQAVFVIIAFWQDKILDTEEVAEVIKVSLFTFSEIQALENQSLIVSARNDKECVLKSWFVVFDLFVDHASWNFGQILELTIRSGIWLSLDHFKRVLVKIKLFI